MEHRNIEYQDDSCGIVQGVILSESETHYAVLWEDLEQIIDYPKEVSDEWTFISEPSSTLPKSQQQ